MIALEIPCGSIESSSQTLAHPGFPGWANLAASRRRSLAGLRRTYTLATGTTLASSAFQDRFTPALAELMKQLTECAFEKLSRGSTRMCLALRAFTRVFLVDGSLIRLPDALEDDYPSVWAHHTKAGAKVHLVVNAKTRTPTITRIVPGCQHDLNLMTTGSWCREALLVFDLAYYQGRLFQRIMDVGGSFLCRVKKDANFVVLRAADPPTSCRLERGWRNAIAAGRSTSNFVTKIL